MQRIVIAIAAFVFGIATAFAAQDMIQPQPVPGQILRAGATTTGQPIELPSRADVIVSRTSIPVGGSTPTHKHPYQRYVYVLSGHLTVHEEATDKTLEFNAGDFLPEMRDAWHFGSNPGAEPVQLLVIDQVPPGTPNNMVMKQ